MRADRRHARQPADGHRDPGRVRRARGAVRGRLRGAADRPQRVRGLSAAPPELAMRANVCPDPRSGRSRVGVLWIAAARSCRATALIAIWIVALVARLRRPVRRLLGPGLGRSPPTDWEIERAHFAERFQLFVIIALGESIVVTGRDGLESRPRRPRAAGDRRRVPRRRPRSGGCTSTTSRASRSVRLDAADDRAGSRATPTRTSTSRSWPGSSSPPSATSS